MNAYNITDPTVLDYAECLWHLNRVLWFTWLVNELSGWSSPTQSLRVWGSNPLVTLRFFLCAIVVPNVQYLSRNTVHKYEYGTKPQLCPHACTRYRRTINKSINYHPETVKKLSSTADCSFISSLAVYDASNGVLLWTLNERSNCDLVAFQIRITYQYSKNKLLLTSWGRPILAGKGTVTN